ncbi:MAG: OmpA family protein [Spirochaetes bacterium]|nr:OmpA family protein [Spirochaetota bacterium]
MRKNTGIIFLILVFVLTGYGTAFAADPMPGSQFFYLGMGAGNFSLGGAGSSQLGNPEGIFYNPALMAVNEQFRIGLNYGAIGADNNYSSLGFSLPSSRGVFTFNILYADTPGTGILESGKTTGLKSAFSKMITPHFLFGFGINIMNTEFRPGNSSDFAGAFDLGFMFLETGTDIEIKKSLKEKGFGFRDFIFGFSFMNLGWGLDSGGYRSFPDASLKTGVSFSFFKSSIIDISFMGDLTVPFSDFQVRANFGAGARFFDILNARIGVVVGNKNLGPITLGLSINPKIADGSLELAYALVPFDFNNNINETGHFVSLNVTFGALDREPPVVRMKSRVEHFSPNNDGVKDNVIFDISIGDNRILKGWVVEIKDSKGRIVKRLTSHGESRETLSFKLFFEKLFARKQSVKVPKTWVWNGTGTDGKRVADGVYTFQARAWDAKKNMGFSTKGTIVVDTVAPQADLKVNLTLFSPNNDGKKDFIIIDQKTTGKDVDWQGIIKNDKGKVVRKFTWKKRPDGKQKWDGKDNDGKIVKDGIYTYILKGIDKAGNKIEKKLTNITVSTKLTAVDVSTDRDAFSPNKDNVADTVTFTPVIENRKFFESWKLLITDKLGNEIKSYSGKIRVPAKIIWNGQTKDGLTVNDGVYSYILYAFYKDGNNPKSFKKKIIVDTKAPVIYLKTSPKLFSPDEDGENDQLKIIIKIDDVSPIKKWKLVIKEKGRIFKTFTGVNLKKSSFIIIWNGKSDKGMIVESASKYKIEMYAWDLLGNKGKSNISEIEIDILVIKTSRGLKIRISNIEFAFNKWVLKKPNSPILNRVGEILKKYADYKVLIEGYTDNIGNRNYNIMLSSRRARTVMKYLIKRGIKAERMIAQGLGMARPVASNRTSWGRAKNRRVEFILVKDE